MPAIGQPKEPPNVLTCDVCSATPPTLWLYYHPQFEFMSIGGRMFAQEGYWGVCDPCVALVQANDLKGLLQRASQSLDAPGLPIVAILGEYYSSFLKLKHGPPRIVTSVAHANQLMTDLGYKET